MATDDERKKWDAQVHLYAHYTRKDDPPSYWDDLQGWVESLPPMPRWVENYCLGERAHEPEPEFDRTQWHRWVEELTRQLKGDDGDGERGPGDG